MGRSRRTRRQQVYGERKKKRPGRKPPLAKKEVIITPLKAPEIQTGTTLDIKPKKIKVRRPTVKPRRSAMASSTARSREILIVSRKGQPQIFTKIKALERKNYPPTSVSSSWLSTYGYFYNDKIGTFTTKTGRQYKIINFDFDTWEEWYYAHSKGTYFNEFIKDQYTIKGTL